MKKVKQIPITRPTLEPFSAYAPLFKKSLKTGMLTNGEHVHEFERRAAKYLGVKHCVAVSSCTAGLTLVLKGLRIKGEVILPSFTFGASGHPVLWNNLTPVFADIDPDTYTLDPHSIEKCITKKTSAILGVHVYGVPCGVKALRRIARKYKLKLIFDAAHAFGSLVGRARVGSFGDAEVFSLSPVKPLTAAEGGLVATNDDALAQYVRLGRNYGDDGTNSMLFAGLSARMSELHAAVALRSLTKLSQNLKSRRAKARYLKSALQKVEPRLQFQKIPAGVRTTYYIFSVLVGPALGYTRDELYEFLQKQGIRSRKYFYPPLHAQPAFRAFVPRAPLAATERVARHVLALPMYSHIKKHELDRVAAAFRRFVTIQERRATGIKASKKVPSCRSRQ